MSRPPQRRRASIEKTFRRLINKYQIRGGPVSKGQPCPTEAIAPHATRSESQLSALISLAFSPGIRVAVSMVVGNERRAGGGHMKLDRILVPLDGSMLAETALAAACSLAARDGATI